MDSTSKKPPKKRWYLPDSESGDPVGPYRTEDIQSRLSAGTLRFDEFIYCSLWAQTGEKSWKRIFEVVDFTENLEKRPPTLSVPVPPAPSFKPAKPASSPAPVTAPPPVAKAAAKPVSKPVVRPTPQPAPQTVAQKVPQTVQRRQPVRPEPAVRPHQRIESRPEPRPEPRQPGEYTTENNYRRYPRVPLEVPIILHDHKRVITARCADISEKGVFVLLDEKDPFEKGEELVVTLRGVPGIGTFSVSTVVIRVLNHDGKKGVGLFFLRMSPKLRRQIAEFVMHELAHAPRATREVA